MSSVDLDTIEALARAAKDGAPDQDGPQWFGGTDCLPDLDESDAAFIVEASPDVVLALVDRLRRAEAAAEAVAAYATKPDMTNYRLLFDARAAWEAVSGDSDRGGT